MKKKTIISLLMLPFMLSACNGEPPAHTPNVPVYKITFASDDGTVLKSYQVRKKMVPSYDGATPFKYCDDYLNEYQFIGWDKEIVAATENTVYTAKFELKERVHDYDLSYQYNDVAYEGDVGTSYGGWMLEFHIGRCANEGDTYNCLTGSETVGQLKSSNPDVVELSKGTSASSFNLKAKKAGNSVIKIYNNYGELIYRQLIRVRPKHTPEEILKMLYISDSFVTQKDVAALYGNWRFMCIEDSNRPTCLFTGSDGTENGMYASFNLEYTGHIGNDMDLYQYRVRDLDTNATQTTLYEIDITPTGDIMYVYYNSGFETHLLGMLTNSEVSYIYK